MLHWNSSKQAVLVISAGADMVEAMNEPKTYRKTPEGWVPCEPPTPEQRRSMEEQRQRMFTPDGNLRRVIEIREAFQKGLVKPGAGNPP